MDFGCIALGLLLLRGYLMKDRLFYSLPPGTPKEMVTILRAAFMATMRDPEFLAEAKKAKLEIDPRSGEEVESLIARYFSLEASLIGKLRQILGPPKR